MTRKTNENDRETLERRLARLVPAPRDELASSILNEIENLQETRPRILSERKTEQDRRPRFSPFLAGLLGVMVGASAMYLVMTLAPSPEIEIRQVVVETPKTVAVDAVPAPATIAVKNETNPVSGVTAGHFPLSIIFETKYPAACPISSVPLDLDEIIDRHEERVRRGRLIANRPAVLFRQTFKESVPPVSRAEYREMMRRALESL